MKRNVGGIDRGLRLAAGVVILALGAVYRSWWGLLGLLPLSTGLIGWCPPYTWFGISTRKAPKAPGA
ncbi:MAG TPA: DUF2892 domain-containing protein [Candidatus Saccharimonadales bacterium]|nr:DUF2892 domain-containing protein [Candidatus Saccharimonadales bacterium]